MNSTNSEIEMEHCASLVAPVSYTQSAKNSPHDHWNETGSSNKFGTSLESADQDVLSTGSSKDRKSRKKQRMFRKAREVLNAASLPLNDSDDDFRESVYDIPLAQHVNGTCNIGSHNIQPMETGSEIPPGNEFTTEQVNAVLPHASTSELPHAFSASSANYDAFGVRGLVDSFIDDLSSARRRQCEQNGSETSLPTACKKKKFWEWKKHMPSKEYSSSSLSSSLFGAYLPESVSSAGDFRCEIQADSNSSVFAGMLGDPGADIHRNSMARHCSKSKDTKMATSCNDEIMGTSAVVCNNSNSKQRRYQRKRKINYDDNCFDRTFDIPGLDEQTENVRQSHRSQSSSMGNFTDTASAGGLEYPKTSSDLISRKEKLTKSSCVTATHSITSSNSCENFDVDAGGVSMARSGLGDMECRYQNETSAAAGNNSATVDNLVSACARSASVITSKQKKSKLRTSSSVGSSSCSNDINERAVSLGLCESSNASSLFSHADKNDTDAMFQSRAAADRYYKDSATHSKMNEQDTSGGRHIHMVRNAGGRFRTDDRGVDDLSQTDAASASNSSSTGSRKEKERLKNTRSRLSRGRRILYYSDDDNEAELPVSNDVGTLSSVSTAHRASESAVCDVSSVNDVIVLDSDDEGTAGMQSVNESEGQQRSGIESGMITRPVQSSVCIGERHLQQPHRRWRMPVTARMSCGG